MVRVRWGDGKVGLNYIFPRRWHAVWILKNKVYIHSICWTMFLKAPYSVMRTHIFSLTPVKLWTALSAPDRTAARRTSCLLFCPPPLQRLILQASVLSRFRCYRSLFGGIDLLLGVHVLRCGFCFTLFRREHPCQSSSSCAVAALPWEAEEGGPNEGAAAGEGGPQVQRHQGEVHKLRETDKEHRVFISLDWYITCLYVN